jgi:DNA-binding NtrC family response regulator
LVVDDDDDVRAFLVRALQALGHECLGVVGGPAALADLERSTYDVVLIDFAMPGMSGPELADAIMERWPRQKFVMISGYAGTSVVASAARGMAVLSKPINVDDLREAIDLALQQDSAGRG